VIETRTSGIWQTNSAVISAGGEVLVTDPAFFPRELEELAALVRSRGDEVTVVFTHGHWDHVAGWRHFPGARVLGSASLAAAVAANDATARDNLAQLRDFDGRWYVPRHAPAAWPPLVQAIEDGERLHVGRHEIEALSVPGHSADGLALFVPEARLLLPGDYLSPCEIPFVEDLGAYRATLQRFMALLPRLDSVVPGHGPEIRRGEAAALLEADLAYLDALASCAAAGDREAALALRLPRAADVPGMADAHRKNCDAAGLRGAERGPAA
jgi:glyoxylase-like metal-dependent hydrolase (beta-lactamase superfamily II)